VKSAADRPCQVSIWGPAFTLPVKSVSNERRILLCVAGREPSLGTLAGFKKRQTVRQQDRRNEARLSVLIP
jgi:hypothetical protein